MKNQNLQNSIITGEMENHTHLNSLVSKLVSGLLPEAVAKRSFIVNEVDASVFIDADQQKLSYIIGGMVGNAVYSTSECCIRVETIFNQGALHLKVSNDGVFIYSSRMHSLGHIVDAAREMGGNISLYSEKNRGITVMLSFVSKNVA